MAGGCAWNMHVGGGVHAGDMATKVDNTLECILV